MFKNDYEPSTIQAYRKAQSGQSLYWVQPPRAFLLFGKIRSEFLFRTIIGLLWESLE